MNEHDNKWKKKRVNGQLSWVEFEAFPKSPKQTNRRCLKCTEKIVNRRIFIAFFLLPELQVIKFKANNFLMGSCASSNGVIWGDELAHCRSTRTCTFKFKHKTQHSNDVRGSTHLASLLRPKI